MVILNILMVRLDDLDGLGGTLENAGIRSLDMALIENAGDASAALAKVLQAAFPKVKIVSSMLLWIAQLRPAIAQEGSQGLYQALLRIHG